MKATSLALIAALAALPLGSAAWAGPGNAGGCPPGLAKKSPACVPPGQAKKHDDHVQYYQRGDRIEVYQRLERPTRYGLDGHDDYVVADGNVYRINQETGEVLAFIGALANLVN
jgi:hypothetical protein